jgi:hypothetical protein
MCYIAAKSLKFSRRHTQAEFIQIGRLCHQSPAFHSGGPGSLPGQSMWDLWWARHWDWFFSKFFGFPISVPFRGCSMFIYHLGNEQLARWWPQFINVVSIFIEIV